MPVATHGLGEGRDAGAARGAAARPSCCRTRITWRSGPGVEVVAALGGLHALMGWSRPILTDSGGFQVMSLAGLVARRRRGRALPLARRRAARAPAARGRGRRSRKRSASTSRCRSTSACPRTPPPARGRAGGARARPRGRRAVWPRAGGRDMALFGIVQGGLDVALRAESAGAISWRSASTATPSAACPSASRPRRPRASPPRPSACCPRAGRATSWGWGRPAICLPLRAWDMTCSIASCPPETRGTGCSSPAKASS